MSHRFLPFRVDHRLARAGLATLVFLLIEAGACAATGLLPGGNPSPRSFNDLRAAAEKGDAIAQRLVANAYLTGEGVKQDPTEGVKWVKLAADQRDPYAQYTLGILYDEGTALPRNLKEAVKWYSLAAAQGLPDAQFNLAICYSKGEGVERDLKLAAGWFRKAAEQGDALSQFHLGLAYISGKGVERNHAEATSWLRKAAYQEVPAAQFYLGRLYQEGEGVAPEADTAVKWYRKAAAQGYADAQFYLGRALLAGEGAERNPAEGRAWLEKAAAQKHEGAAQLLAQGPSSPSATAALVPPATPAVSPMSAAAAGQLAVKNPAPSFPVPPAPAAAVAPSPSSPSLTASLPFTVPATESTTNQHLASTLREPSLATPALPPVGKSPEAVPPTKAVTAGSSGNESGLPPSTAPSAAKETPAASASRDMFTLPRSGAEANPGSPFADPIRAREPLPTMRETAAHVPPPGQESSHGLMLIAAVSTGISALILFLGVYVAVIFKTRLQGLEAELKKAQFELSKANVNLSAMMHQVEQLALAAPATAAKASLPEWNPEPVKAHASSFKVNRAK